MESVVMAQAMVSSGARPSGSVGLPLLWPGVDRVVLRLTPL